MSSDRDGARGCPINVAYEAFRRSIGWDSNEWWRFVCSKWGRENSDGGLVVLGERDRRSVSSQRLVVNW